MPSTSRAVSDASDDDGARCGDDSLLIFIRAAIRSYCVLHKAINAKTR